MHDLHFTLLLFKDKTMKKISIFLVSAALLMFIACETAPVQEAPKVSSSNVWVKTSNEQLAKVPVEGFGYKSSKVPSQKWDKWAAVAAPVVKGIVDSLPADYVLVIKGHTDARGPEESTGNKPGNIKISADRAKSVEASLKKQGVSSDKIITKGAGSSEPLSGVDAKDEAQRRVTFEVAPK
jgi:outer membrane protein OmpA-like peptidoglycan-associated protein